METSEKIDLIATAFVKAQGEIQNPPKNKTNPHYNSKYVDLSDGLDVIRKTLSSHGIAFVQGTKAHDNHIVLHTRLIHTSGQWMESTYPVSGFEKPQAMGSALTYARRYAIFSLVGVAGEEDDDGNAAQEGKPAAAAKKPMKPGITPEDSEKILSVMSATLELATSLEDLKDWANSNQNAKMEMLPEHQRKIVDQFIAVRKMLAAKNA